MNQLPPLLAQDFGDFIWIAFVILFIIVPAIGQMISKMRQQGQKPGGGGPRPARRVPVEAVEDEIGDFLRRAVQRGAAQKPAEGPQPPRPAQPPMMAEVAALVPDEEQPLGSRLRQHVGEYLDEKEFSNWASKLGAEVAQADEHLAEHLHEALDHQLSRVAAKPGESSVAPGVDQPAGREDLSGEVPAVAVAGLPVLLSNPQNLRQAIIITEILQRPEDRWA